MCTGVMILQDLKKFYMFEELKKSKVFLKVTEYVKRWSYLFIGTTIFKKIIICGRRGKINLRYF